MDDGQNSRIPFHNPAIAARVTITAQDILEEWNALLESAPNFEIIAIGNRLIKKETNVTEEMIIGFQPNGVQL